MDDARTSLAKGYRLVLQFTIFVIALGLAGCLATPPRPPATSTPVPTEVSTTEATAAPAATPVAEAQSTTSGAASITANPAVAGNAFPPAALSIPEIEMDVIVSPMGWRVAEANGVRTTVWVLPDTGAGWHPNSAGAGDNGNVVISGHQLLGDAAFAPIALGDVAAGQRILLTDTQGQIFTYEVVDVSDPLPLSKAIKAEQALAAQYTTQTDVPTLTLISGWPDFSSTHRVIVTAELVTANE